MFYKSNDSFTLEHKIMIQLVFPPQSSSSVSRHLTRTKRSKSKGFLCVIHIMFGFIEITLKSSFLTTSHILSKNQYFPILVCYLMKDDISEILKEEKD